MAEKPFYEVSDYTGYLREGAHITVQRDMRYLGENADFKPFLNVPIADLEQQLKDSKAAEKKVYDDLQTMAKAWDEHGARTLLLERAIEYLKTPIVEHTGNEWKQREDGTWEISNLVYKMTFRILKSADVWIHRLTTASSSSEKRFNSTDRSVPSSPDDRISVSSMIAMLRFSMSAGLIKCMSSNMVPS